MIYYSTVMARYSLFVLKVPLSIWRSQTLLPLIPLARYIYPTIVKVQFQTSLFRIMITWVATKIERSVASEPSQSSKKTHKYLYRQLLELAAKFAGLPVFVDNFLDLSCTQTGSQTDAQRYKVKTLSAAILGGGSYESRIILVPEVFRCGLNFSSDFHVWGWDPAAAFKNSPRPYRRLGPSTQ